MKSRALLIAALALLLLPSLATAQDNPKHAADKIIRLIVAEQKSDGSYGSGLADTCRVLDLLGRSPRRYTELDGPFYRSAAQRVAAAKPGDVPDALVALGLAATVTAPLQRVHDAAVQRLHAEPPGSDVDLWLALRTFPASTELPAASFDAKTEPELACLSAADPSTVPEPAVTDVAAWTSWARAARLRGVRPDALPPLPVADEKASLAELMAALETAIQMHGLYEPPVFRVDDDDADAAEPGLPALVASALPLDAALAEAAAFFARHQRHGTFGLELTGWEEPEPGITALCLTAVAAAADIRHEPRPEWLGEGLDYLVARQQPDGSIQENGLATYTTSVAIEALVAGARAKDAPVIEKARAFLMAGQFDESRGYDQGVDAYYGGVGYGDGERPDLSNSQMAIEAVAAAGAPASSPFFTKALLFLESCQNFSAGEPAISIRPAGGSLLGGTDGGGFYLPGVSYAGEVHLSEGVYRLRSYGSMTYALAKSYILCGVPADDERLAAAMHWLAENFSVDSNPGFTSETEGRQGLYYYYLALGRTLRRVAPDAFADKAGKPIAWREMLTRKLLENQRIDGSWINADSARWFEGAPTLCTAYAVLALTDANS